MSVLFPPGQTHILKQCMNSVIWSICDSGRSHTTTTLSSTSALLVSDTEKPVRWLTVTQVTTEHQIRKSSPIVVGFWDFRPYTSCFIHLSYTNNNDLALWRGSHKKEERSTKGRERAGAHYGQEKLGFSGHPPLCKSMFRSVLFFSPQKIKSIWKLLHPSV